MCGCATSTPLALCFKLSQSLASALSSATLIIILSLIVFLVVIVIINLYNSIDSKPIVTSRGQIIKELGKDVKILTKETRALPQLPLLQKYSASFSSVAAPSLHLGHLLRRPLHR